MSNVPVPLRFVPTLTEVVQPEDLSPVSTLSSELPSEPVTAPAPAKTDLSNATDQPLPLSGAQEELMVQRVLQRIDVVLEQRLREVVDQLILEHTQALAPRLRQEIELVVRESVVQAFEQEAPSASAQP